MTNCEALCFMRAVMNIALQMLDCEAKLLTLMTRANWRLHDDPNTGYGLRKVTWVVRHGLRLHWFCHRMKRRMLEYLRSELSAVRI